MIPVIKIYAYSYCFNRWVLKPIHLLVERVQRRWLNDALALRQWTACQTRNSCPKHRPFRHKWSFWRSKSCLGYYLTSWYIWEKYVPDITVMIDLSVLCTPSREVGGSDFICMRNVTLTNVMHLSTGLSGVVTWPIEHHDLFLFAFVMRNFRVSLVIVEKSEGLSVVDSVSF